MQPIWKRSEDVRWRSWRTEDKHKESGKVRFYKDTQYIGVNYSARDTLGEWREEINLQAFWGKPYNKYDYDEIYIYSDAIWQHFTDMAIEQGKATNRKVVQAQGNLYLAPIWIHGVPVTS